MYKKESQKIVIDIIRIAIFLISCAFFATSFLPKTDKSGLNNPSNAFAFLLCFTISACLETLSRFYNELNLSKEIKILNIVEVSFGILVIICGILLINFESALSVLGLICAVVFFGLKTYRLIKFFHSYLKDKKPED
jgi:small-conductance mechanosensitive channel